MTKMAAMPIYVVKSFKNQLLSRWTDFNKTWYVVLGALTVIVYINHDLGLTMTYLTVKNKQKGQYCQKDLKVGRYRQFIVLIIM